MKGGKEVTGEGGQGGLHERRSAGITGKGGQEEITGE